MIMHEYLVRLRHDELLAEGEHNRLLGKAKHRPVSDKSTYSRVLAWFGVLMCSWDSLLVKCFGEEAAVSHSPIDRSLKV